MTKPIVKISRQDDRIFQDRRRFEHWFVDNQVYFVTARCREQFPAFAKEAAKAVFWDRFDHYTQAHGFTPWVTSLLDNHYHTIGYLQLGENLPKMMHRIPGSVAKLVNDQLPRRRLQFWGDARGREYFDGCIRDEKQARLAYRYTLTQGVRHGIANRWEDYPHTHVQVELERAIARSRELNAFLQGVPYKRYCPF